MLSINLVREPLPSYQARIRSIIGGLQSLNPESPEQLRHRYFLLDAMNSSLSGEHRPILQIKVEKSLAKADGRPILQIRTSTSIQSVRIPGAQQ